MNWESQSKEHLKVSQYQDFNHSRRQRLASFPRRKPYPSSKRSSEQPQATRTAPLEQRKLCWHWNVSCTPRETSSNLSIIHKRVGLVPKVPWEVIQKKKKEKIKSNSIPQKETEGIWICTKILPPQHPEPLLRHWEIKHCHGSRYWRKAQKMFFLPICLKRFIDFGDSPPGKLRQKQGGKYTFCAQ